MLGINLARTKKLRSARSFVVYENFQYGTMQALGTAIKCFHSKREVKISDLVSEALGHTGLAVLSPERYTRLSVHNRVFALILLLYVWPYFIPYLILFEQICPPVILAHKTYRCEPSSQAF